MLPPSPEPGPGPTEVERRGEQQMRLGATASTALRDLAQELRRQGHEPTVIVPAPDLDARWAVDMVDGVEVLRLRAPRSKDVGHVRRFFAELRLPHALRRGLSTSPLAATRWDGIAWYSPSIFFGHNPAWT